MRESRSLARKLVTVRGLGQDTSADESATDWVTKMREKEKEKKLAEQRVSGVIHALYVVYACT